MHRIMGSGIITRVESKELGGKLATIVTAPVNDRKKIGGEWQDVTCWYELSAWDNRATDWAERFMVGDAIEFEGRPDISAYANRDGEIKISYRVKDAFIEFAPRGRNKEARENGAHDLAGAGSAPGPTTFDDVPF